MVRQASSQSGAFPKVSIWHGTSDTTVSPINGTEEMEQWTNVHGIDSTSAVHDTVKGFPHQTFSKTNGDAVIETYSITGMARGEPVDPGTSEINAELQVRSLSMLIFLELLYRKVLGIE